VIYFNRRPQLDADKPLRQEFEMQELQNLSKFQVELAFQLLYQMWGRSEQYLLHSQIPSPLSHLREEEWAMLEEALESVYEERLLSNLH
jgi:hypothetical protein